MDSLSKIFRDREIEQVKHKNLVRSERDELMKKFLGKEIKIVDRKTKELREATIAEIAIILRKYKTDKLYAFYRECEKQKSFPKYFWWALKNK